MTRNSSNSAFKLNEKQSIWHYANSVTNSAPWLEATQTTQGKRILTANKITTQQSTRKRNLDCYSAELGKTNSKEQLGQNSEKRTQHTINSDSSATINWHTSTNLPRTTNKTQKSQEIGNNTQKIAAKTKETEQLTTQPNYRNSAITQISTNPARRRERTSNTSMQILN